VARMRKLSPDEDQERVTPDFLHTLTMELYWGVNIFWCCEECNEWKTLSNDSIFQFVRERLLSLIKESPLNLKARLRQIGKEFLQLQKEERDKRKEEEEKSKG
jgi:hypothetical protein